MRKAFSDPEIKLIFDAYSDAVREKLLDIRELIFQISEQNDEIGLIDETLKWGQPSYLTYQPKSGTTLRLSGSEHHYILSVHCQTTLISDFRAIYPDVEYDGNRSMLFDVESKMPKGLLKHFIVCALSYHHRKKQPLKY